MMESDDDDLEANLFPKPGYNLAPEGWEDVKDEVTTATHNHPFGSNATSPSVTDTDVTNSTFYRGKSMSGVRSIATSTRYAQDDGKYFEAPDEIQLENQDQVRIVVMENSLMRIFSWRNFCLAIFCLLVLLCVVGIVLSVLVVAENIQNSNNNNSRSNTLDNHPLKYYNTTLSFANSTLSVTPSSNMCNYNYTCSELCTPALDRLTGCCVGCKADAQCGLSIGITYKTVPKMTDLLFIYIFASVDGVNFWQTGSPAFVTSTQRNGLFTDGTGTVTNGCYGFPRTLITTGCLTNLNLTNTHLTTTGGFPKKQCLVYGGQCTKLNNVWQIDPPTCAPNGTWTGSATTISALLPTRVLILSGFYILLFGLL